MSEKMTKEDYELLELVSDYTKEIEILKTRIFLKDEVIAAYAKQVDELIHDLNNEKTISLGFQELFNSVNDKSYYSGMIEQINSQKKYIKHLKTQYCFRGCDKQNENINVIQ